MINARKLKKGDELLNEAGKSCLVISVKRSLCDPSLDLITVNYGRVKGRPVNKGSGYASVFYPMPGVGD